MNAAPSFGVSVDIKCLLILLILTLERTFQEKKKLRYLFDVSLCFWFIQKFPFRGHCRCQTRGQWGWIDNCGGHWTDGFEAVVGDWRTTNDAGLRSWTMDAWWCWDRVRGCQKLWGCILKNKYKFIFYKFYYVKRYLTSSLSKSQRDSPMGVGISKKYMVGFEGLWVHNNFWNFFGPKGIDRKVIPE